MEVSLKYKLSAYNMCLTRPRKSGKPSQTCPSRRKSTSETSTQSGVTSGITSSTGRTSSEQLSRDSKSSTSSSLLGVRKMVSDGVMVFKYKELSRATNNFGPAAKIGASSFKARVRNREAVIVLRKKGVVPNLLHKLKILCSVHHASVVKLLGACFSEGEHLYLAYEYVAGLNLCESLRNSRTPGFTVLNSWVKRLQVAMELAQGLEYLHDYTHGGFIHKHIKSTNVIVDADLHAKIANFGIPQMTGEIHWRASDEPSTSDEDDEVDMPKGKNRRLNRLNSVRLTGAPGYMAPEYISMGLITKKIDVFSFGVILLELLTGKEPANVKYSSTGNVYTNLSLPDMAREIVNDNHWDRKLRLWMDPLLKDSYPLESIYEVVLLAKACVEPNPDDRPDMRDVAVKLVGLIEVLKSWESSTRTARSFQSKTMEAR